MQQPWQEQLAKLMLPKVVVTQRGGMYVARWPGFANFCFGSTPDEAKTRVHNSYWTKEQRLNWHKATHKRFPH